MRSIRDFNIKNKRVLVRCDFNVPLDEKRIIQDDFRIKQAIPTIEYLVKNKTKVILMSHLGRPKGEVVEELRLGPVQDKLVEYLGLPVIKVSDCVGKEIEEQTRKIKKGEILLLENLRFHKEEEENDLNFAKKLSWLGDIYINDAFSVCHRLHASVVGITQYLDSGSGFLLEKEVKVLSKVLENPERPLVAIIGGKKIEDKAGVIEKFRKIADYLLIGGKIGEFLARQNFAERQNFGGQGVLILPLDGVIKDDLVLDIGSKTIDKFSEIVRKAKTIFWAGPMGKFEEPAFEKGTRKIVQAIVKNKKAYKIAGGGDTLFALAKFDLRDKFDHLSTGGGAMLDFLAGKELPGLKALCQKSKI